NSDAMLWNLNQLTRCEHGERRLPVHVSELAVVLDPATEQAVVVDLVFLFLLKITSLILAFLTIRMGFVLIREGAKGGFTFKANLVGLKADLASVSPGLLFVLLGICLMGY